DDLNRLIKTIKAKNLRVSSWYGKFDLTGEPHTFERINRGYGYRGLESAEDDVNFPWFLYWEIVWVVLNNKFSQNQKILDLGGSSSLFSYYLASKGLDVTTVDLSKALVDNANLVAEKMRWKLKNYLMDMKDLNFNSQFEHITSICVYEHIPMYERVSINKKIRELLSEGGFFSITFDYRNPSRAAKISSPEDILQQFVRPSGLEVRGNRDFLDNGKNYLLHPFYADPSEKTWRFRVELLKSKISSILKNEFYPWEVFRKKIVNDYTFGALFLKKIDYN
ncbi:MAG: class I SAM-dependent methyltransferase, partial [Candidatus Omnitrophota bacterium]